MRTLTGTWQLVRFIIRRERLRLSIWVLLLALVPIGTANAFIGLYPDEASREALVATVAASPALTSLLGPLHGSSIGALTAWRAGSLGAFIVALMVILTMIRHTREEEETGRRELLGATVLGRNAPLTAALVVTVGAGLLLGLVLAGGFIGIGLPAAGSVAFGMGYAGVAVAFAGVGALAAQLTEAASTARGIAIGIAGVTFLLRMAGDSDSEALGWLTWLSPIGWFSKLRPFAGEQWGILALWLGLGAVMVAGAAFIASRRDVGAGALSPRAGPAQAGRGLASPLGLAWRLQRGSVLGWTAGLAVLGGVYGASANSIGDMLEGNPQLAEILEQMGGEQGLTDTFFGAAIGIIALAAAAYAIRAVLRLDVEENGERADPVLATATSRFSWAWSHLVFGLFGPVVILGAAGLVAGLTYGLIIGDVAGQVPGVLAAAMVHLPAVWVLTGAAIAFYGLAPRYVGLSWGLLVAFLVLGQLGQILQFPQWALDLSPFTHIPMVPAEQLQPLPVAVLLFIVAALIGAGLAGLRRRDMR